MGYRGTDGTFARAPLEPGVQCVKQTWNEVDHSFLVYHTDAVNYGWHVGEVRLFDSYDPVTGKCVGTCKTGELSPDCHYNDDLGERGTPVPQNVKVSGTYPGKVKQALKDADPATEWWTDELALSRRTGSGGWFSFGAHWEINIQCVRVEMTCSDQQPKTFALHRGMSGFAPESPAFSTAGVPFLEPGRPAWLSTVHAQLGPSDKSVDFNVGCGIVNAQYFGENFKDYKDVPLPCHCQLICLEHVDEGCVSWKWYGETQHCFLMKSVFVGDDDASEVPAGGALNTPRAVDRRGTVAPGAPVEGTGWWKLPFATGWPGWITGAMAPFPTGMTTQPAAVAVAVPFSITVSGTPMPVVEGDRQRIKIIAEDGNCVTSLPPQFVDGVGCSNDVTCAPKPEVFDAVSATWSGIAFASAKADAKYKVCYCPGSCWSDQSWEEVPGLLEVAASPYSFFVDAKVVATSLSSGFTIRVSRPAFSRITPVTSWRL
jgi:hypothetical protein